MAYVVHHAVTSASDAPNVVGDLFKGVAFFIMQRVPFRSSYVEKVNRNGGRVVAKETDADHIIGDPLKSKDAPLGAISYQYIDSAIDLGRLPGADEFMIHSQHNTTELGTSSVSMTTTKKRLQAADARTTRTPFTREEDIALYKFVAGEPPGKRKGGAIYVQYAATNPRHTWQSYLDRYRRYLHNDPTLAAAVKATQESLASLPTPPTDQIPLARSPSDGSERAAVTDLPNARQKQADGRPENPTDRPRVGLRLPDVIVARAANEPPDRARQQYDGSYDGHNDQSRILVDCPDPMEARETSSAQKSEQSPVHVPIASRKRSRGGSVSPLNSPDAKKQRVRLVDEHATVEDRNLSAESSSEDDEMDPLTAETVARRDATHDIQIAHVTGRALDLPEDESDQDQGDFARFLASTMNTRKAISPRHGAERRDVAIRQGTEPDHDAVEQPQDALDEAYESSADEEASRSISDQSDDSAGSIELSFAAHPLADENTPTMSTRARYSATTPERAVLSQNTNPFTIDSPSSADYAQWPPLSGSADRPAAGRVDLDVLGSLGPDSPPGQSSDLLDAGDLVRQAELLRAKPSIERHTQAVFDAETQLPDFTVPDPVEFDLSSDDPRCSDEQGIGEATEVEPLEAPLDDENIMAYVRAKQAEGYDLSAIQFALERSSMRALLADAVLYASKRGKGVPQGFRGIWSEDDDRNLLGTNVDKLAKLDRIHKEDECEARRLWLEEYNSTT